MGNRPYAVEMGGAAGKGLTGVSLFASFGLGDLGYRAAGIEHLVMAELVKKRCDHLRRNFADASVIEGDLRDTADQVTEAVERRLAGRELFMLSATPPCQGMSSNGAGRIAKAVRLGKRPKMNPRNRLVLPALQVIKRLRPRWVLFENVRQMSNTVIEHEGGHRRILDIIAGELGADYAGRAEVVDFSRYGVPQRRRRLITIYTRDPDGRKLLAEKGTLLPSPTHQQPITLRQAIGGFEPLDARTNLRSVSDPLHRVKRIGQQYEAVRNTPEGGTAFDNQCANCGCGDNPVFKEKQGAHLPTRCVACGERLPRPMIMEDGE